MSLNVAAYIEPLLYHQDAVNIPDLGSLMTAYRSASIDHVQGLLHPPSRSIIFNDQITVDDGSLAKAIQADGNISLEEAQLAIRDFIQQATEKLNKREIVVFPGVGRLYKDYEGRFQFLQDSSNFNQDSYGLPSVQFYPILRTKETAAREAPLPDQAAFQSAARPSRTKSLEKNLRAVLPLLAGFAVMTLGIMFFLVNNPNSNVLSDSFKIPVAERINKKPSQEEITTMSIIDTNNGTVAITRNEPESYPEEEITPVVDLEEAELGPSRQKGVIIIGAYKFKKSIQKIADQVVAQGFDVYQQRIGDSDIIRVGAQFAYENPSDLRRIHRIIKDEIEDRAWILEQ